MRGPSDDFDTGERVRGAWLRHYLPQWSSRALRAATWAVEGSELVLSIPPEQGLWCAGDHEPPLRVSGVQSGVFSGEVGSRTGQQPYRDGLVVREAQPAHWGWTPRYGRVEVRARMELSPRSMASVWLVGREEQPDESGEVCVFEVFGDAVDPGRSAAVGAGVHPFRDPRLTDDFAAVRLDLDVREHHRYAVDWQPGRVDVLVDDVPVRSVGQAPDYPMQLMVAVFDFPTRSDAGAGHVPVLAVDRIGVR